MKPVFALVGRPNVGKSTLFNRLTRSRDAIVADMPGLTRDRQYGDAKWNEFDFIVIDTGGITGDEQGIDNYMRDQSMQAVEEAHAVLFLVDAQVGVTPADESLAQVLRLRQKPVYLVVNKVDGLNQDVVVADFFRLGLGDPCAIAAAHGRGISHMLEQVFEHLPKPEEAPDAEAERVEKGIKMAIVGRPNVGKSTLVNRMLGEDRVIVFDMPGTTRDSVYIPYERHGQRYTIIDTAGVRKRGKVNETVEKFSVIKTLQAVEDANVVVMVLDAQENIVEQDLHLLGFVLETGRSLVLAINKWDGMHADAKQRIKSEIERRLQFVDFAKIHFISAKHGTGVGELYRSIQKAYDSAFKKLTTPFLTKILEDALTDHQPPLVNGRRIKLRYAHMGGSNPPLVVIHGNQTERVPKSYRRYLENTFRRVMDIEGTPIRIEFKTGENPFAGRRNTLTPRQIHKKERMVAHHKKLEKKKKKR
ncbi:ribosome biogenesis GTPase Der [Ketobacter sp. MCCC 1A13808]|uniref:ribosome biogenesis GTPase Der n=1 Tax=Ketobacter sp. MCCC 1A13808 TaxID=2602738 RepID=UPI000F22F21E|nr:ribosome biogenesis GTPase Der [Ketobacter sp. MCCC 1A13808]MVF14541.1 ribosome biogenesis GTPase Der [Ketobacter sp. MCCC 1A13808]RLP54153.1 MAG: ribosome biogenesis GTPase Der [Ketobacter sp.]